MKHSSQYLIEAEVEVSVVSEMIFKWYFGGQNKRNLHMFFIKCLNGFLTTCNICHTTLQNQLIISYLGSFGGNCGFFGSASIFLPMSWSWSYGSWIYNYIYKQTQSPLKLWYRITLMVRCTRYSISLSVTCGRPMVFSGYWVSSTNKTDGHDITEICWSGIKHHNPTPSMFYLQNTQPCWLDSIFIWHAF